MRQLAVQTFGPEDGRLVVFLHPANVGGRIWDGPVSELIGLRGLCPDLPGFGGSSNVAFGGFEDAADLVADAIRHQATGAVPVVGYSYGAYVGFQLALRHPDLVERLMFVSGQVTEIKGAWWMVPFMAVMTPLVASRKAREKGLEKLGIARGSSWFPNDIGDCKPASLFRVGAAAMRFEARIEAQTLKVPVLAVAGTREHPAVRETISYFEHDVATARGRLAEGGHAWPATASNTFTATLAAFLADERLPEDLKAPEARLPH